MGKFQRTIRSNSKPAKTLPLAKRMALRSNANADTKGRYQVEGEMIRATYGHSIELELDLPTDDIPEALYWPCDPETVSTHMEYGISR